MYWGVRNKFYRWQPRWEMADDFHQSNFIFVSLGINMAPLFETVL